MQLFKNVRTRYRKPANMEEVWVLFDPGNGDVKIMLHENWGEERFFPHAVRLMSDPEWEDTRAEYQGSKADYYQSAVFYYGGMGYVVGQHALSSGNYEDRKGVTKYEREHMGALLVAGLLMLNIPSHKKVNVVVTHPSDVTAPNKKKLTNALKGSHNAMLPDGEKRSWNVDKVVRLVEPIAGFNTFMLNQRGGEYIHPQVKFAQDRKYLVIDIGAWLTAFVEVTVTPTGVELDRTNKYVYRHGIQDVISAFDRIIRKRYPVLDDLQEIPIDMIVNALASDTIRISGKEYDCEKEVDESMKVISAPIRTVYRNTFGGGVNYDAIVFTGGGGGMAYHHFNDKILQHDFVYTAERELDKMRYSQIRGASKALISYLDQRGYYG